MKTFWLFIIGIFLLPCVGVWAGDVVAPLTVSDYENHFSLDKRVSELEDDQRYRWLPPETVLSAMSLEKGDTVLDIGAGSGFFAIPMALEIGSTGIVYATEVDEEKYALLQQRKQDRSLKSLEPVLVSGDGVDLFYGEQAYDVILLSEVVEYLVDPASYLGQLYSYMAEGKGRLYVVSFNPFSPFRIDDVANPVIMLNLLAEYGPDSPVRMRMPEKVQSILKDWDGSGDAPEWAAEELLAGISACLHDKQFFNELNRFLDVRNGQSGSLLKTMPYHYLAWMKWLFFERSTSVDPNAFNTMLNKLALQTYFGSTALKDPMNHNFQRAFFYSKEGLIRLCEGAGFQFVESHELLPYHFLLEFRWER